jgi:hypothetical protein
VTQRGMVPLTFPVTGTERDHPQLVEATSVFLHKLTYDVPMRIYGNKGRLDQVVVTFRNEGRGWVLQVTARGWPITSTPRKRRRVDIFTGRYLLADAAQEAVKLALDEVGLLPEDLLNPYEDGRQWQEPE